MRILIVDTDAPVDKVTLYLTRAEARELTDAVEAMLSRSESTHEHVADEGYQREITVSLYDPSDLTSLDERSRRLVD
jgi:hypothetical protein